MRPITPTLLASAIATLIAAAPVTAQTLTGVKVEPAQIRAGESAKITAGFEVSGGINCGLRLHFGDGAQMDYKINQASDVPLVVTHAYTKPGTYEIKAEPKRNGMILGCMGKNQTSALTVAGGAAAAAGAGTPAKGPTKAAAPNCPDGWKLDAASVNRKTGAFNCTAKPGTAVPATRLACPGDLGYHENPKKGVLGCR